MPIGGSTKHLTTIVDPVRRKRSQVRHRAVLVEERMRSVRRWEREACDLSSVVKGVCLRPDVRSAQAAQVMRYAVAIQKRRHLPCGQGCVSDDFVRLVDSL